MQPPFTINNQILNLVADISEQLGKISVTHSQDIDLRLRRINQVRTIHGTLAIEGNELTEAQVTAILGGKRVLAPVKEVQEAKNAIAVYEKLTNWDPETESNLLDAHKCLMMGMIDSAGQYRNSGVGVMKDGQVIHMAPPADRTPTLMRDLFEWLKSSDDHPLIKSCVFHYEFEFIHPFSDGNGRMGRLWQTLILSHWQPLFAVLPVENLIHQYGVLRRNRRNFRFDILMIFRNFKYTISNTLRQPFHPFGKAEITWVLNADVIHLNL